MTPSLWVAVLALGLSAISIGWQIWTWWHLQRLSLVVRLTSDTRQMEWQGGYQVLQVFDASFRNDGVFEVNLKEAGFYGIGTNNQPLTWRLTDRLPAPVKARDEFVWNVPYTALAGFGMDLSRGIQAWGTLVGGQVAYSSIVRPVQAGQLALPSATPRARPAGDRALQPPPEHSRVPWRQWGRRAW